jgi:hypothetical protein
MAGCKYTWDLASQAPVTVFSTCVSRLVPCFLPYDLTVAVYQIKHAFGIIRICGFRLGFIYGLCMKVVCLIFFHFVCS